MSGDLLKRAQAILSLQDVYVREAKVRAAPDFDPTNEFNNLNIQFKINPAIPAEHFELETLGGRIKILRYLVETGLRMLKPGVDATSTAISEEQLLGEITATFVVKYQIADGEDKPQAELVAAFCDNAVHHMWPYWREFLQASTARCRLPAVILPMRKVDKSAEAAQVISGSDIPAQ